ncbi:MAG: hypothetical protein K0R18_238 [Bacillales bacterium]|nr:hypothetical protein [Bacillales bacterium]
MEQEIKHPIEVLEEKVGVENAIKWIVTVKQMIEQDDENEQLQSEETTVA